VASNLEKGIANQIRATRDKRGWSQTELAGAAGMGQNNVSRLESPDYGRHTISSLKRIAEALDVALVVRFVPFGQYIDWLSGTPHLDNGLTPEALAVASFADEERAGVFDRHVLYYPVYTTCLNQNMRFATGSLSTSRIQRVLLDAQHSGQITGKNGYFQMQPTPTKKWEFERAVSNG
jgi:transcriptional regulator with XRE-family HTH domain